jgi:hypothetical protein
VFTIAALLFLEGSVEPWPCTVRDLSRGGARLELDRTRPPRMSEQLPEHVLLHFCPERTEVGCRVAWRDGRHFGVQFTSEIRPSAQRPV